MATKQKGKQPKQPAKPREKAAKPAAKKAALKPKAKPAKAAKPKAAAKKAAPKPQPSKKATPKPKAETAKAAPAASPMAASPTPSSATPSSAQSKNIPTLSAGSLTDGGGTRYLTVQDLVELHRAVSSEFGGTQAHPGVIDSQFGLLNAVQRPQVTTLGREAYPSFPDKVAAFIFALLTARPFRGGNRRLALASLLAFCELNNKTVDSRVFDEKTAETLLKRAGSFRELGIPPENVFREIRETLSRAIVPV